jgi:hypothetical protein
MEAQRDAEQTVGTPRGSLDDGNLPVGSAKWRHEHAIADGCIRLDKAIEQAIEAYIERHAKR